MAFKKGQSGNPGGRPKVVGAIQELARAEGPASIQALVEIRDNTKANPSARAAAANALLDRGYGRPPQFTTGDSENFRRAIEMSDDELASVIAQRSGNGAAKAPVDPTKLN